MRAGARKSGHFEDTDDVMRLAQGRDPMAGQGWQGLIAFPALMVVHPVKRTKSLSAIARFPRAQSFRQMA
jgi:hypothetical protein